MTCASAWAGYRTVRLQDTENLVTGDNCEELARAQSRSECAERTLDLSDAVRVTKDLANLGGSGTLLCELADLLNNLLGSGLQPSGGVARVGDRGGRYSLSVAVKTTHFGGFVRGAGVSTGVEMRKSRLSSGHRSRNSLRQALTGVRRAVGARLPERSVKNHKTHRSDARDCNLQYSHN